MLIQGKILSSGDDLTEAFDIRKKVFVDEFGFNKDEVFDEFDEMAMHVIVYEEDSNWKDKKNNSKSVATGRIIYDGVICKIEKVSVLKEYRRKKYGDFTVRMLLNKAFIAGVNNVVIETLDSAVEFFEKIGFTKESEYNNEGKKYFTMSIQSNNVIKQCKK